MSASTVGKNYIIEIVRKIAPTHARSLSPNQFRIPLPQCSAIWQREGIKHADTVNTSIHTTLQTRRYTLSYVIQSLLYTVIPLRFQVGKALLIF